MKRLLLAAALTATIALGAAAPTTAVPLPQAASCNGVWVVVDYGSLGGVSTKCASSYGTGLKALRSAGFSPTVEDGFVLKINGKPGNPDPNQAYWSYWHAKQTDDGSYSNWSYSSLGAEAYHPKKGDAEGWRYQKLSEGKTPPGARPPAVRAAEPSPTKKKSTSKPSAKASATDSASAKASASGTPAKSASESPAPVASPSAANSETDPQPIQAAQDQVAEVEPATDSGSPLGLIVAAALVVVAAAGLGGWWFLKGRKS